MMLNSYDKINEKEGRLSKFNINEDYDNKTNDPYIPVNIRTKNPIYPPGNLKGTPEFKAIMERSIEKHKQWQLEMAKISKQVAKLDVEKRQEAL